MVDWLADSATLGIAKFGYDKYLDLKQEDEHKDELKKARQLGREECLHELSQRSVLEGGIDFEHPSCLEDPEDIDDPYDPQNM